MSFDTLRPNEREDPAVMEAVRAFRKCADADAEMALATGRYVTTHPLLIGNALYRPAVATRSERPAVATRSERPSTYSS